jgi:hypothetical protein
MGTQLIAGGDFTAAGGQPANNIAAWDGTSWSPLGSGLNGIVTSMTVHNGQLVAAGTFTNAGGVAANHIASWDGTSWSPLGPGRDVVPAVIESYSGRVFTGTNTTIGSNPPQPISLLEAWNGTTWQAISLFFPGVGPGNPFDVQITGLDVADGKLFIGGLLADQQGYYYNGTSLIGTGRAGDFIYAFAEFGGAVYEGGYNPLIGRWDGIVTWTANINGSIAWEGAVAYDLETFGNVLVMAGGLDGIQDPPNLYLVTWDGTNWSTLGTGVNGIVESLAVMNGRLFAGGLFTTADGDPALHIAQWSETPVSAKPMTWGAVKAMYRNKR